MRRGYPPRLQFVGQALGYHEGAFRGSMEQAHDRPDPIRWNTGAKRDIVGEARMEAGGEAPAPFQTPAPRRPADRPFGSDMDRVRLQRIELAPDVAAAAQCEANLGIGRAWPVTEQA